MLARLLSVAAISSILQVICLTSCKHHMTPNEVGRSLGPTLILLERHQPILAEYVGRVCTKTPYDDCQLALIALLTMSLDNSIQVVPEQQTDLLQHLLRAHLTNRRLNRAVFTTLRNSESRSQAIGTTDGSIKRARSRLTTMLLTIHGGEDSVAVVAQSDVAWDGGVGRGWSVERLTERNPVSDPSALRMLAEEGLVVLPQAAIPAAAYIHLTGKPATWYSATWETPWGEVLVEGQQGLLGTHGSYVYDNIDTPLLHKTSHGYELHTKYGVPLQDGLINLSVFIFCENPGSQVRPGAPARPTLFDLERWDVVRSLCEGFRADGPHAVEADLHLEVVR